MKNRKIKSIISLTAALVTVFAISVVTFAAYKNQTVNYGFDNVGGRTELGYENTYDGGVGYAEVTSSCNAYLSLEATVKYYIAGVLKNSYMVKSSDETTYLQDGITCPGSIKKLQCYFRIVSDEGAGSIDYYIAEPGYENS